MKKEDIVISIKEASRILNTSKGEVYKLVNNDRIASIKQGNSTFVYLSEIKKLKSKKSITKKSASIANRSGLLKRIGSNLILQISSLFVISILAILFSKYFIYPKLEVLVKKDRFNPPGQSIYTVNISNISNQDIYNFDFSIRFDENYPIKEYGLDEINYESGIILRSTEDLSIKRVFDQKKIDPKSILMSGFRGSTDRFPAGTVIRINVRIDTTYSGNRGDVYPPMMYPSLRPKSYFLEYNYRPFGITIDKFFGKKLCYDFNNEKSTDDYFREYSQKIALLDGQYEEFVFRISGTR